MVTLTPPDIDALMKLAVAPSKIVKKTVSRPRRFTSPTDGPVKLPAEGVEAAENKKIKTEQENGGGSSSNPPTQKKLFENVWSNHDEMVIMEAMLKLRKEGKDPRADIAGVLASIMHKLDVEAATAATETKLRRKLRAMKKKYENNIENAEKGMRLTNGLDPVLYSLMKEFFAGEEKVSSKKPKGCKTNGKKLVTKTVGETSSKELRKEVQEGLSSYPCLLKVFEELKNIPAGPSGLTETEAVAKLGPEQIKEFENQFKKVKEEEEKVKEAEKKVKEAKDKVYWKRVMLTSSIMNALKSSLILRVAVEFTCSN